MRPLSSRLSAVIVPQPTALCRPDSAVLETWGGKMIGEGPDAPQGIGQQCLPLRVAEEVDLHPRIVATSMTRAVITRHCPWLVLQRSSVMPTALMPRVAGHRCRPTRGIVGVDLHLRKATTLSLRLAITIMNPHLTETVLCRSRSGTDLERLDLILDIRGCEV